MATTTLTKEKIRIVAVRVARTKMAVHGRTNKDAYYTYKVALASCETILKEMGIDIKLLPEF